MSRSWWGPASACLLVALTAIFYRGLLFGGLILGDYDAFVYFYPLRQYAAEAIAQGRFPLWNPYLFMGAPFFANVQTALLYPPNVLFLLLPTPYAYSASVVSHVLLAGASMYIFSRRSLGVSPLPAALAAATFMFSGFMSGQVGHINQLNVAAWLPLLLVAFDEAVRRRSLALGIGAGLVGAVQLLAGHTQEWYFSTVTLGLFALWRIVAPAPSHGPHNGDGMRARLRPLGYLSLIGLIEAGLTAVQTLPTRELSEQSIRGGGMAYGEVVSFSLPPTTALFTMLPTYPTELFSEYIGYVGIVPLLLAGLALAGWAARPVSVFMACLAGLGLFLALGRYNPVYPLLYDWVPGIDLFRVPARWLLVYTFGVAGLAGLGAQAVLGAGPEVGKGLVPFRPARSASVGGGGQAPALRQRIAARRAGGPDTGGQSEFLGTPHTPSGGRMPCAPTPWARWTGGDGGVLRFFAAAAMVGGGVLVVGLFYLAATPKPDPGDVTVWGGLVVAALLLVVVARLAPRAGWIVVALLGLITVGELWVAGGNLPSRHPIPYEAYRPDRSSTSFILEDASMRESPGRLLSFATDKYEVKETPDYKQQFDWLGEDSLYQFLVAVKLNEALASNLPMEYGIETVDGYDGGILPLKRYAGLKTVLLPKPGVAADNPLRMNLPYAPPVRLLDLLNVRYVLGTKIQDTLVDNVYYDRGVSVVLGPGESTSLRRMPDTMTTSLGVISSTEGAREREDGVPAATLVLTDVSGATYELPLRLGMETGETPERNGQNKPPSHQRPMLIPAWASGETDADFYAKIHLPTRIRVKDVSVKNLLPDSKVRIRAITLIDDVAATSSPLVLSDRLDRELFFDMKLYTNRDALPRAFMVHNSLVRDDDAALAILRSPEFPVDQAVLLASSATARTIYRSPDARSEPAEVTLRTHRPEEVVVDVKTPQDGYLVLLDAFYPGWTVRVDGVEAPIEIADYFFRGVFVERGEHTVVFEYVPSSFQTGMRITLASLAALCGTLLALVARHGRRVRTGVI